MDSEDSYQRSYYQKYDEKHNPRSKIGEWEDKVDHKSSKSFRDMGSRNSDKQHYSRYEYKERSSSFLDTGDDWAHDKFNIHERHFSEKDGPFRRNNPRNGYKRLNGPRKSKKGKKMFVPSDDFVVLNLKSKGKEKLSENIYLPTYVDDSTMREFEKIVRNQIGREKIADEKFEQLMIGIYSKICSKFRRNNKYYRKRLDTLIENFLEKRGREKVDFV